MLKYNNMFYEPVVILDQLTSEYSAEMSNDQLAFLCGLIEEYRPNKIVEVGVSAGGTTAVILKCISMLKLKPEFYSLDLSTLFYRDQRKQTGYLAEECKKILGSEVKHSLYTGKYAVEYLEEIGADIDFLILDTVHSMPGELLDFLAFYPYLKQSAIVVVHDIALNLFHNQPDAFATKVLLDTVAARKFYGMDGDSLLNIGAFMINSDTGRYIDNIFSALTLTWKSFPKKEELTLYREFYQKHYNNGNLELFDAAVRMNYRSWEERLKEEKRKKKEELMRAYKWIEGIKQKDKVYIYGCGYYGKKLYELLDALEICLGGFLVSDGQEKANMENIYFISEVDVDTTREVILLGVDDSLYEDIGARLSERGIYDYVIPPRFIYSYLG